MANWGVLLLTLSIIHNCISKPDYDVDSESCKIPNIDPFNEEIMKFMNPLAYIPCNKTKHLTYITKDETSATLRTVTRGFPNNCTCCYSYITRSGTIDYPDVGIHASPCVYFQKKVHLLNDIVMVKCFVFDAPLQAPKLVYENVYNPIITKTWVKNKINTKKKPSILFIVVDSLSRLNFIRTMPQTYNYLTDNGFVDMKGYTKVDDNTFPNCMALLSGLNLAQANTLCNPKQVGRLDTCPLIWYNFRNLGYITAYAEDDPGIATFNYWKKGFSAPPTDYYFKSYFEAAELLEVVERYKMPYCTGPETSGERVLNLAKDFSTTFKQQSTFGIFWMNTFSHNNINMAYTMDGKIRQFFEEIKNQGVLDESIVVFLSDHGIRFGAARTTSSGWFEERMPANFISVPKTFQKQFPNEFFNLQENSKKFVNTFDFYMTLQHLLVLGGSDYKITPSLACPKCQSLFRQIADRSCNDSAVSSEWCPCIGKLEEIEENQDFIVNATVLALVKINQGLLENCEKYTLDNIITTNISESLGYKETRNLFVVFKTKPLAIFLVTVIFENFVDDRSVFYIKRLDNINNFCFRTLNFTDLK